MVIFSDDGGDAFSTFTRTTIKAKRVVPSTVSLNIGQSIQFYLETLYSDGNTSRQIVSGMSCAGGTFSSPGLFTANAKGTWSITYPNATSATIVIGTTKTLSSTTVQPTSSPTITLVPSSVDTISVDTIGTTSTVPTTTDSRIAPPGPLTPPTTPTSTPTIPPPSSPSPPTAPNPNPIPTPTGSGITPPGPLTPPTTPTVPEIPPFTPPTTPVFDQFLYFMPSVVDAQYIRNSGLAIPNQTIQVGNNSSGANSVSLEVNFSNTDLVSIVPAKIYLLPGEKKSVLVQFNQVELVKLQQDGLYTVNILADVRGNVITPPTTPPPTTPPPTTGGGSGTGGGTSTGGGGGGSTDGGDGFTDDNTRIV